MLTREQAISRLQSGEHFDLLVIGGGATGAGVALDAASRKYRVALIEREDFGSGTSSKSSKLVHGGVRYLANGEFSLVREALHERALLLQNAAHLVKPQGFVIPVKHVGEKLKFSLGLWLYDKLAGDDKFERSRRLSFAQLQAALPTLDTAQFNGAVRYSDAQFDDTRLLWDIIDKARSYDATVANYCRATGIIKHNGKITGVEVLDRESGSQFSIKAKAVINATGAWSDEIVAFDQTNQSGGIIASQGTHVVVDRKFFPGEEALLIPETSDGRVMFVIPWHDRVVIGTTDEGLPSGSTEASPTSGEIDLILATSGEYLATAPGRADILACFAGIRPLSASGDGASTAKISREHRIDVAHSGLITITGGKWTTYRRMAEDCVNMMEKSTDLPPRECVTKNTLINTPANDQRYSDYGCYAAELASLAAQQPALGERLNPALPYTLAEVTWAVQNEMARSIMDVLARRTRALFLDARAAIASAPTVAEILSLELGKDSQWMEAELNRFYQQAQSFLVDV